MITAARPQSWPLLVILGVVVALVALVLVAQHLDPDRQRHAAQRQAMVGEGWRPRKVVRRIPADDPDDHNTSPPDNRGRSTPSTEGAEAGDADATDTDPSPAATPEDGSSR